MGCYSKAVLINPYDVDQPGLITGIELAADEYLRIPLRTTDFGEIMFYVEQTRGALEGFTYSFYDSHRAVYPDSMGAADDEGVDNPLKSLQAYHRVGLATVVDSGSSKNVTVEEKHGWPFSNTDETNNDPDNYYNRNRIYLELKVNGGIELIESSIEGVPPASDKDFVVCGYFIPGA
jgi:hypothetical protein